MFPRDHIYSAEELVKLWISQGYVQTNGLKNAEKIGFEYAKQLWQRSFFQGEYERNEYIEKEFYYFSLHDMVHDLARFNSGRVCYSIEGNMVPKFPEELYHLYVNRWIKFPPPSKFATLRSFIVKDIIVKDNAVASLGAFNFSEAQNLRALQLCRLVNLESHFLFAKLKHLRYLSINMGYLVRLSECICYLYNLQYLTLNCCPPNQRVTRMYRKSC
ncbi:hypothetical protein LUZ63_016772 [Rhynchospora breviuscula]|uniref:Disease resistance protein winged helix domain-containing protein n=1 Tax=Rhynchospora breviuscula TaxID=2022672 RepID=A0A9Q0C1E4_9POAL|nr:hypothetical protein LUZ63_016772 [Rhynchospora breviuscula]